nr:hypothetical protein [Tanacetum cinerariifolium]
ILWGVVNRAYLDYAERILEEFTQSIHTFIEDKRNLAHHTHEKKKATLIVIPKPVLGYLKFSAKGTKRKVFGMSIPGSLITANIQETVKVNNTKVYLEYNKTRKFAKVTPVGPCIAVGPDIQHMAVGPVEWHRPVGPIEEVAGTDVM